MLKLLLRNKKGKSKSDEYQNSVCKQITYM